MEMESTKIKYLQCAGVSKHYPVKLDFAGSVRSIISSKRFDQQKYKALNNISFDLYEGDRLGIIGTNGAGKSTLLKILGDVIKPSSGHISLKGKSSAILEPNNLLYKELTGIENIRIVGRLLGISKKEIEYKIEEIIAFSEIGPYIHQLVRYYSSGMMLRLTMAIYKCLKPDILLMDEVLSVGDANFRSKIFDAFAKDFSQIPVIILVSHEMSDILSFCNKCLYLKDGELVHFGNTHEVYESYNLEHFGRKIEDDLNDVVEVNLQSHHSCITKRYSEDIQLQFEIDIKRDVSDFKMVFYLSSSSGPVLTDSLTFREDHMQDLRAGNYQMTITIPAFLLNKGEYYTNCIIETGEQNLIGDFSLGKICVVPDSWEADKLWNVSPKYPVRPRLGWKLEML